VAYRVTFVRAAAKQLRKLAKNTQKRLVETIEDLASDPRPNGSKKLAGPEGLSE
jgi:mRNA interferase RelE/StbE